MKCEDFEKYLFENPEAKVYPDSFSEHLKDCEKCSSLWKIQESLANFGKEEIPLSFSPAKRTNLILQAKKELFNKSASSLIEDSLVVSLLLSFFVFGIIISLPNLPRFQFFEEIKPYLKMTTNFIAPIFNKFQAVFSNQSNLIMGAVGLFIIIFALTLFVKTLTPKRISVSI